MYDDIDTAEPMEIERSFVSSPAASPPPPTDHSYTTVTPQTKLCQKCNDKTSLINSLVDKVNKLSIQTKRATRDRMFNCKNSFFTWRKIKADAKIKFYTGIQSIAMFNVLFLLLSPY